MGDPRKVARNGRRQKQAQYEACILAALSQHRERSMPFQSPIRSLHVSDPDVRELAWAIGGPSLMAPLPSMDLIRSEEFSEHVAKARGWLMELDRDPQPLRERLANKPDWKVGLRFETLVGYWLEQCSDYLLLGQNVQVRHERQTLGAFDFVVRSACGRLEHWELAIKYYLQRDPSNAWSAWVGPNAKDRLDLKLNRMAEHQLPLSQTAAGRQALQQLAGADDVVRRAWVKGMFFRPWRGEGHRPEGAACDEPRGRWLHRSQLPAFAREVGASRWLRRDKPRWLAPARVADGCSLETAAWLDAMAEAELARPIMASRLVPDSDSAWVEVERLFVVPDSWPQKPSRPTD